MASHNSEPQIRGVYILAIEPHILSQRDVSLNLGVPRKIGTTFVSDRLYVCQTCISQICYDHIECTGNLKIDIPWRYQDTDKQSVTLLLGHPCMYLLLIVLGRLMN